MIYGEKILMTCLIGLMAAFVICASSAQILTLKNLDFGLYGGDGPESQLIFDSCENADVYVNCHSELSCKVFSRVPPKGVVSPRKFKLAGIKPLLETSKQKRLVVISLEKGVMKRGSKGVSKVVQEFLELTKDVGFKRVVIIGAAGNGVHYLADTQRILIPKGGGPESKESVPKGGGPESKESVPKGGGPES